MRATSTHLGAHAKREQVGHRGQSCAADGCACNDELRGRMRMRAAGDVARGRGRGGWGGGGGAAHPAAVVLVPQGLGGRQIHVLHAGGLGHVAWQQARRMALVGRQAVSRRHHRVCLRVDIPQIDVRSMSYDCNAASQEAREAMFSWFLDYSRRKMGRLSSAQFCLRMRLGVDAVCSMLPA